jgi:hypothetical protein
MTQVGIFALKFPLMPFAVDLLKVMEENPHFKKGPCPHLTTTFLSRIEDANPNSPDVSEDDSGSNWGHLQFTGGAMTIRSVLTSWECVGCTEIAQGLIAAAIKTCKVMRVFCHQCNIQTSSYLSDVYLQELVERIWTLWNEAGGVCCIYFLMLQND